MQSTLQICPCQIVPTAHDLSAPLLYKDCCQPYHDSLLSQETAKNDSVKAESAERLMRTRYSAFVLVKPDYIVKTTLPAQQNLLDIQSIESWARDTDWSGLEILNHTPKIGKRHSQVEFNAYFNDKTGLQAHHELSSFVKIVNKADNDGSWYFLDPTVSMPVTQKQPCICGSGEKFKRCCGIYI